MAYERQSKSLMDVQRNAPLLEKFVKERVGGKGGSLQYADQENAKLQVDLVVPDTEHSETLCSITHTNPDTPGHSNENKLQLKIGELYLFKTYKPNLRCVLVMGGTRKAWLPYVIDAFDIFFDKVVHVWDKDFERQLAIANRCPLRHVRFWHAERQRRESISLATSPTDAPVSFLRERFHDYIANARLRLTSPEDISNPILRLMASAAYEVYSATDGKTGKFWEHLIHQRYDRIWQERNYFNPIEAAVSCVLQEQGFLHLGQLGKDVERRNLLHDFGMTETGVSEDFVLFSRRYNKPVCIQCKSSGGGREHHGKNIMNRAKEQIARSILYRCRKAPKQHTIVSLPQDFIWIAVLDGDWRMPRDHPLKYLHMLQIAGYDRVFGADSLVDNELRPKPASEFVRYLREMLECAESVVLSAEEQQQLMSTLSV